MHKNSHTDFSLCSLWAIDALHLSTQLALISQFKAEPIVVDPLLSCKIYDPNERKFICSDNIPIGSVAVINVRGSITKYSYWSLGVEDYIKLLRAFEEDARICGVVLNIDSPGGTVAGMYEFSDTVSNYSKPIVSYSNDIIASAAYWIASASNHIVMNNKLCQVGSIGVVSSFSDLQPYFEKMGIKFHNILSDLSPDKNRIYEDVMQGKYKEYKEKQLNPCAQTFKDSVQAFRPEVKEEACTGEMYFADKAIELGLIDEIGNFTVAIDRVLEISGFEPSSKDDSAKEKKKNKNKNTTMSTKIEKVTLFLGAEQEITAEGSHLSAEQLESLEARFEAESTAAANAEAAATSAAAAATENANLLAEKEETIKGLQKDNADLAAQVKALNANPAAGSASDTKPNDATGKVETDPVLACATAGGDTNAILKAYKENR